MSDRNLFLPERALGQRLKKNAKALTSIERRIMWPGAHKESADRSAYPLPIFDTNFDEPDEVWANVATVTLDPGRWLIVGCATLIINRSTIYGDSSDYTAARIGPIDISENRRTTIFTDQVTGNAFIAITTWSTTVVPSGTLAVTLDIWYGNVFASGTGRVQDTRLTAIPL